MGKILLCSRGDYSASKHIHSVLLNKFGSNLLWAKNRESMETFLSSADVEWVVFPFWSWLIPDFVIKTYKCISFHTGDLPKDRGGSPIQNQIMAGKESTMLSAFKTSKEMDEGPVYLKCPLSLAGDLMDIHKRISKLVPSMVIEIIDKGIVPTPQKGAPSYLERRKPEQSEINPSEMSAREIYNLVRCLNMKPYPHAFLLGKDGKKVFILKARLEE